ncbi:MAG: Prolyl oligopeptidase family [Planctomycetota bacterium]|jgi:hypothetical protein
MRSFILVCGFLAAMGAGEGADRDAAQRLAEARRYREAAEAYATISARRSDAEIEYRQAAAWAQAGDATKADLGLRRAIIMGFDDPARLETDAAFTALRAAPAFARHVKAAAWQAGQRAYRAGVAITGIRTLFSPPGWRLPWRLRLPPEADSQHRARLLVWLHPSGAAALEAAEALAAPLAKAGWGLLVFQEKDWSGWSPQDIDLMLKSISHVSMLPEVDAARPALWGFSAGGQVALQLHGMKPAAWSAIVIGSAYPVGLREQGWPLQPPPSGPGLAGTPILVTTGEKDPLSARWQEAEPAWKAAGIPLTVRRMPGKAHADWSFEGAMATEMVDLLARLPAGATAAAAASATTPVTPPVPATRARLVR